MAQGPAIQTGTFTSDGTDKSILLRADVDRVVVENLTEMTATNSGHGFRYTWYLGLDKSMIMEYHPAADHTSAISVISNAILPIDRFSIRDDLTFTSITAGTNAVQPVYSTADTSDIDTGSIVRIYGTDQTNLNGLDFTVNSVVTNTSFRLANTLATAPGIVAGASGSYMVVAYNDFSYRSFISTEIKISSVSLASNAVITTLSTHYIEPGATIRIIIPSVYGMPEIADGIATVLNTTSNTLLINIDTTTYTAFNFPIFSDYPFEFATVEQIESEEEDDVAVDSSGEDAITKESSALVAMKLAAGTAMPAGSIGDEIRWTVYNAASENDEFYDAP